MTQIEIPNLGHAGAKTLYRTEPGLRSGAELPRQAAVIVGQRESNPTPKAAVLLGKIAEQTASKGMTQWAVWFDATFPHVILIAGKRGSGKSYDLGILAEGLCADDSTIAHGTSPFSMILFDTQNQFWTLTRTRTDLADADQKRLRDWKIDVERISPPVVYRPRGTPSVTNFEVEFAIRPSDLEADDWTALCGLDRFDAMGQCLRAARAAMPQDFSLQAMVAWLASNDAVQRFAPATRDGVAWRLEAVSDTDLFDPAADDLTMRLATTGSKSVIQLAELDDSTKSVVVAVIMRRLVRWAGPAQRRRKMAQFFDTQESDEHAVAPRIWVLIDEAHLVCPSGRATAARPVIIDYVKRGRDAGLSLVVATQQPSALDTSVISQCDVVSIHKLTIDHDIAAATARMPARPPNKVTKLPGTADISRMDELARALDSGQALLADAESSRAFIMQSRPRVTPHGGGEPDL